MSDIHVSINKMIPTLVNPIVTLGDKPAVSANKMQPPNKSKTVKNGGVESRFDGH